MPLWEVEELASLWVYIFKRYVPILQEISNDLTSHGRRYITELDIDLPPTILDRTTGLCPGSKYIHYFPCRAATEPNIQKVGDDITNREKLTILGPRFFYKVLNGQYRERRDLVIANLGCFAYSFIYDTILPSDAFPLLYPADKYDRDDLEQTLPKLPQTEQPNVAWTRY